MLKDLLYIFKTGGEFALVLKEFSKTGKSETVYSSVFGVPGT